MKSSGFTLVEVQISLVILVLIMSVIIGGIQLSDRSGKAIGLLAEKSRDKRIISQLLSRQINSLLPLTAIENGKSTLIFDGDKSSLYFMGYLPEHVVKGGPWFIHLYQKNDQLILDYKPFDNTQSVASNKTMKFESVPLLNNIKYFSMFYLADRKPLASWKTSWDKKDTLPSTVKIQIKQESEAWPALIVPVYSYTAIKTPVHVLTIE